VRHDIVLEGPAFRLRPVRLDDADDILRLRRDPSRSRFIHETDPSPDAQRRWLETYFDRDGDYYWAVERRSDASTEGFVGIYDVAGDTAEWGRWVLRQGSLAAPESAWLMYEAGFGRLGLRTILLRVLEENSAVLAFHDRYGAEHTRVLPAYARIDGVDHDAVEALMTPELWAAGGPLLLDMAERAAGLLDRAVAAGT
jgi:RimJ/RimL family protein N-acetyltransferase